MFDRSALNEKDKYRVYFGGNHGITTIRTGNTGGKKLAVIKDSFANSMSEQYPIGLQVIHAHAGSGAIHTSH